MNRHQQQHEIEETRKAYHQLLDEISDDLLDHPSDNPAWTIREVLYHMSLAPRLLSMDLEMIISNRWYYRVIPSAFPKPLFDRANKWYTRRKGRSASRQFLADEYDKAHESTLSALATVNDEEMDMSLNYPDWDPILSGHVTVERLFRYVKDHFDSHEEQIRASLAGKNSE